MGILHKKNMCIRDTTELKLSVSFCLYIFSHVLPLQQFFHTKYEKVKKLKNIAVGQF
jgi:hypothetical protein